MMEDGGGVNGAWPARRSANRRRACPKTLVANGRRREAATDRDGSVIAMIRSVDSTAS